MAKKKGSSNAEVVEEQGELVSSLLGELNSKNKSAYSFYEREDPSEIKHWLSTGSTILDYAISNRRDGGVPFGRIIEINGLESSGKSLLSLHIIANAQKKNGIGMILDTEGRLLDKDFCMRFGVDPKRLIIDNPGTIERCFENIEKAIIKMRSSQKAKDVPFVIVWDSLAASPPQAEVEGSYDPASQIGIGAKAVARGLRKLTQTIGVENICLVVINQLRMKINSIPFSDPYVTPYGKSLPYYASIRLRVAQNKAIKTPEKKNPTQIGVGCTVKVIKNSLGPPQRMADFPIMYGYGVDDKQSIHDFLNSAGWLEKVQGKTKFKFNGQDYSMPHSEWKEFLAVPENMNGIEDVLESMLVRKYEDPSKHFECVSEALEAQEG